MIYSVQLAEARAGVSARIFSKKGEWEEYRQYLDSESIKYVAMTTTGSIHLAVINGRIRESTL